MSATTARHTARHTARRVNPPAPILLAACAVAAAGLTLTGGGVYAALNATAANTTAQNASSGTLSLIMAANGVGFGHIVSNLVPGDVVNRYVNLSQGASLDGRALTLSVADATPTKLTTDATKGLRVTVTQCSGTWTTAGACTGGGATTTVLATSVPLSTLTTTPTTLVAGTIAAGSALNLQVSLTLPDQNETTTNGTVPVGTIQGLTAALTWTFTESQRTATTTGS